MFNIKKDIIVGASALALFGVAGATVNTSKNVHADENIAYLLKEAKQHGPVHEAIPQSKAAKKFYNFGHLKYNISEYSKKQLNEMRHGANPNHMTPPQFQSKSNKRYKINYNNIKHHKYVKKNKNHTKLHKAHKVRRMHKVNPMNNTRGYKNYEVKNIAKSLNRLDNKISRTHGRKRTKLIKNINRANNQLNKLVGKRGSNRTHGYKNYSVKNIAKTLNRIDAKVRRMHGKKYAKVMKSLKHANYSLAKLAR